MTIWILIGSALFSRNMRILAAKCDVFTPATPGPNTQLRLAIGMLGWYKMFESSAAADTDKRLRDKGFFESIWTGWMAVRGYGEVRESE